MDVLGPAQLSTVGGGLKLTPKAVTQVYGAAMKEMGALQRQTDVWAFDEPFRYYKYKAAERDPVYAALAAVTRKTNRLGAWLASHLP